MKIKIPYFDTQSLEYFLAVTSIVWGAWLLMPFETFGRMNASGARMNGFGGDLVIGAVVFAIGVIKFLAAKHEKHVRKMAIISAMQWGFVFAVFASVNPTSTAVPIYATLTLANLFILARSTVQ